MEHERTPAGLALGRAVSTPSGKVDGEVKRPMQHQASSWLLSVQKLYALWHAEQRKGAAIARVRSPGEGDPPRG